MNWPAGQLRPVDARDADLKHAEDESLHLLKEVLT